MDNFFQRISLLVICRGGGNPIASNVWRKQREGSYCMEHLSPRAYQTRLQWCTHKGEWGRNLAFIENSTVTEGLKPPFEAGISILNLKRILERGTDYFSISKSWVPSIILLFFHGSSAGQLRNSSFYLLSMAWLSTMGIFPKVGNPNLQGLNLWDLQEGNKDVRKSEKQKWLYTFFLEK